MHNLAQLQVWCGVVMWVVVWVLVDGMLVNFCCRKGGGLTLRWRLQEGVVQDSKDSPVEAVRAFIKRIAGKE